MRRCLPLYAMLTATFIAGCATPPEPDITASKAAGTSAATAIPVRAVNAVDALNQEDRLIKARYPQVERRYSSLAVIDHKVYDLVDVSGNGAATQRIYFEVDRIHGIHEY